MPTKTFASLIATVLLSAQGALACGGPDTPCRIDSGAYHMALPDVEGPKGIVIHLHGGGGRGKGLLKSGLAREALARGYVFISPDGDHPTRRFKRDWSVSGRNMAYDRDDSAFLHAVLADAKSRNGLGDVPVLLAGFSRGGSFVWDMACRPPDFADAYAPLAGAFWDDLPTGCTAPVDLFHTHGWNDRTVPLEGRSFGGGAVVQGDVWASLKILRETNGCTKRQPERSSFEDGAWFRHWTDCDAGSIRLMLHPGGHGAPKGWAVRMMDWFETLPASGSSG
jgi:polyhydroxybutyrate depolymerase